MVRGLMPTPPAKKPAKPATPAKPGEIPIRKFASQPAWAEWLSKHHASSPGLWLELAKVDSGQASVTYPEALDVALMYGWIDGQKSSHDASSFLQKFTPRAAKSIWSKVNREQALALVEAGHMQPAGVAAIESAKREGCWEAAYDGPRHSTVPDDLAALLAKDPKAKVFFDSLNSRNRYAITFRLQTTKAPEARARKLKDFFAMLQRGEKIYP